ncbi:unnamed protein product [Closterium sp. Naga37s-1]|nr:unnamed protein product [Closterium sp. Naga37s-1]
MALQGNGRQPDVMLQGDGRQPEGDAARSFRLTYYVVLNFMARAKGQFNAEHMIAHSFHQFQHNWQVPEVEKRIKQLQAEADALETGTEDEVREYHALRLSLAEKERQLKAEVLCPVRCLHFLHPGRLIRVVDGLDDWGWGVVVNVMKQPSQSNAKSVVTAPSPTASAAAAAPLSTTTYLVDTLLLCSPAVVDEQVVREGSAAAPLVLRPYREAGTSAPRVPRPCALEGNGEMHVAAPLAPHVPLSPPSLPPSPPHPPEIPVKLPAAARTAALKIALPSPPSVPPVPPEYSRSLSGPHSSAQSRPALSFLRSSPPSGVFQIPVKLPAVARIGALRITLPTDLRPKEARQAVLIPVKLPAKARIGALRIALPTDLRPKEARQAVLVSLRDVTQRFPDGLPILDPIEVSEMMGGRRAKRGPPCQAVLVTLKDVNQCFPDGLPILDPVEDMGITDELFLDLVHSIDEEESKLGAPDMGITDESFLDLVHSIDEGRASWPNAEIAEQKLEVLKRRGQLHVPGGDSGAEAGGAQEAREAAGHSVRVTPITCLAPPFSPSHSPSTNPYQAEIAEQKLEVLKRRGQLHAEMAKQKLEVLKRRGQLLAVQPESRLLLAWPPHSRPPTPLPPILTQAEIAEQKLEVLKRRGQLLAEAQRLKMKTRESQQLLAEAQRLKMKTRESQVRVEECCVLGRFVMRREGL